jgi:hypothetical protein
MLVGLGKVQGEDLRIHESDLIMDVELISFESSLESMNWVSLILKLVDRQGLGEE